MVLGEKRIQKCAPVAKLDTFEVGSKWLKRDAIVSLHTSRDLVSKIFHVFKKLPNSHTLKPGLPYRAPSDLKFGTDL